MNGKRGGEDSCTGENVMLTEVIINESKQPTVNGNETLREVFRNRSSAVLSFLSRKSYIQFIVH